MDAHQPLATARILRFLEQEPIVWLSTVRPDGDPHLVPIWFSWDGEALLIFSKPDAQKVRNLRAQPTVMLALGDAEADFDIGLLKGTAELPDTPARDVLTPEHLAKYGEVVEQSPGSIRLKVKRDRVIATCKALLDELPVTDIDIQEVPIEEVIRRIFAHQDQALR